MFEKQHLFFAFVIGFALGMLIVSGASMSKIAAPTAVIPNLKLSCLSRNWNFPSRALA